VTLKQQLLISLQYVFDSEEHSPLQYFKRYFDTDIIEIIVDQTNLSSAQQTTLSVNTNVNEIEQFCGALLYMGIVSMPSYTDFWAQTTNCEKVTSIFRPKRFQNSTVIYILQIMRMLQIRRTGYIKLDQFWMQLLRTVEHKNRSPSAQLME